MFAAAGRPVVTASHSGDADFYFDLSNGAISGLGALPRSVSHALICSALANIDQCRREQALTWRFNVENTGRLIDLLWERGVTPVFCSSDMVFEASPM
jgi:hypothetical protein